MRRRRKSRRPKILPKKQRTVRKRTLLTVLGLLLSSVGALGVIELRPQVVVIPEEAVEPGQPFSAPFQVENTGYSSLYIERVFFCVRRVKFGGSEVSNFVASYDNWANLVLDRGQGESIASHFLQSGMPIDDADVVLVVDSRPWSFFPQAHRSYFRFTRFEGPYRGVWTWLKQPIGDAQTEVDEQIEQWNHNRDLAVLEQLPGTVSRQGRKAASCMTHNTCPHILC